MHSGKLGERLRGRFRRHFRKAFPLGATRNLAQRQGLPLTSASLGEASGELRQASKQPRERAVDTLAMQRNNRTPGDLDAHSLSNVPLARNGTGSIPEGAVAWRVRRHTGGRPRTVVDGKKQPIECPLTYSIEDLEEILPPGSYRLDLVDIAGNSLDYTVTVSIGGAAPPREEDDDGRTASLPATSDTRLVLEAGIRAQQMAFAHNERTLATLKEGIQSLANAQADWIRALVTGQMPVRIEAPAPPPAPLLLSQTRDQTRDHEQDQDQDEDDYDDAPRSERVRRSALEDLLALAPQIMPLLTAAFSGPRALGTRLPAAQPRASGDVSHAPEATAPRNGLSPDLAARLFEARQQLTPTEQTLLSELLGAIAPEDYPAISAGLEGKSVPELVEFAREQFAKTTKVLS